MNLLDLFDVSLGVRVPCRRCVLCYGPNKRLVAGFLNLTATVAQISAQKGTGGISFLCYCVNVCVEAELGVYVDTKVFCCVKKFQLMFMDAVRSKDWFALVSDAQ